jgi:hypothetical protein
MLTGFACGPAAAEAEEPSGTATKVAAGIADVE